MLLSKIFLYEEPSVPEINFDSLANFLQDFFRVPVIKRKNIFHQKGLDVAHDVARTRVYNYRQEFQIHDPTTEEVQFEFESFVNSAKTENIVLYDGFELQKILRGLISDDESKSDILHLVLTNKLTCTFDNSDYRYHGRALIASNPSIISTTGIIEAPAKPREYYMELMSNYGVGLNIDSIKEKYKGSYLEYHDTRLEKIIQGYALQAVFYYITGESFCELLDCRLNNAHWQRDLLYSQLEFGRLCTKHEKIINDWLTLNYSKKMALL